MVTSFPESWDIPSESEFYREAHWDLADLDRAYQWPKRREFNAAITSSGCRCRQRLAHDLTRRGECESTRIFSKRATSTSRRTETDSLPTN